jgi:micrococcal nuclease
MRQDWTYKAKVLRVVDADTLDVELDLGFTVFIRQRLRLVGPGGTYVDAWETRGAERQMGLVAKDFVQGLVDTYPDAVLVRTQRETGKYGRYLAEVEIAGVDLATSLVENGHAEFVYR